MSMRKSLVFTLGAGFMALLSAATQPVLAASGNCTGASCQGAGVSLPLVINVVIPSMIRMQIGATGVTPDTITFNPNPDELGDPTKPQTGTGGNLNGGEVTFLLVSNTPTPVTVTANTSAGGLLCQPGGSCAAGTDFIAWNTITVAGGSKGNGSCGVNPPPQLLDVGADFAQYGSGGPISEDCSWLYTWDNNVVVLDGTYTGTVTYTAVAP